MLDKGLTLLGHGPRAGWLTLAAVLTAVILIGTLWAAGGLRSDSAATSRRSRAGDAFSERASSAGPPPVTAVASSTSTSSPPAQICGNGSILNGPSTQPPGSVRVEPGQDLSGATQANPPGTTFYLTAGIHTLGTGMFNQVAPKDNNTYIGAPGAILDGQGINRYAFTQQATGVTVKHLTIRGFVAPNNEGVVNQGSATGWRVERNTITENKGAGVFLGPDSVVTYNCIDRNGQYGISGFRPAVARGYGPNAITNVVVDHNEISRNNTDDWESRQPGCGCTGGAKFWDVGGAQVTNNWVHHNYNVGLWADTNNVGFLIEGNLIEDNDAEGIWYEISYNFRIANNTLRRNTLVKGRSFEAGGDGFPVGSIYIAESGGDPRVNAAPYQPVYATSEITNNTLENNWGGVVLWEAADRYCSSSANTSSGYCTKVNPNANLTTCAPPSVNNDPYYSDCRWKTQNVVVANNRFSLDKAAIGCTTTFCGRMGLLSNYGVTPPYGAYAVAERVVYGSNNVFRDNTYVGDWRFSVYEPSTLKTWDQWRSAPYAQDPRSVKLLTVPEADEGGCNVSPPDQVIEFAELQLLDLINNYRAANNLNRLVLHPDTTRAAAWFARDMATDNYFSSSHVDNEGRDMRSRLTWCAASYNILGENIAAGYQTPQEVFNAWKASPSHDATMKMVSARTAGLGLATNSGSDFRAYWVLDVTDTPRPPVADYDTNNGTDIGVFRQSNGTWLVRGSDGSDSVVNWGSSGDIPSVGDFDGDGKADVAVFRPTGGLWFIRNSRTGAASILNWGAFGDSPVAGDYDGDGRDDLAVYRPEANLWFIRNSSTGVATIVNWGSAGDVPVPGDFDLDGRDDLAVFRPSSGLWFIRNSSTGAATVFNWGASGDIPKVGDYDRDGREDVAVYRPSNQHWFIHNSSTGAATVVNWGAVGDVPTVGDYDGDGRDDLAVFRPSTGFFYINRSSEGLLVLNWGASGDVPLGRPPLTAP